MWMMRCCFLKILIMDFYHIKKKLINQQRDNLNGFLMSFHWSWLFLVCFIFISFVDICHTYRYTTRTRLDLSPRRLHLQLQNQRSSFPDDSSIDEKKTVIKSESSMDIVVESQTGEAIVEISAGPQFSRALVFLSRAAAIGLLTGLGCPEPNLSQHNPNCHNLTRTCHIGFTGLGIVAFKLSISSTAEFFYSTLADALPKPAFYWPLALYPIIGSIGDHASCHN
jgi:hypothetical protein